MLLFNGSYVIQYITAGEESKCNNSNVRQMTYCISTLHQGIYFILLIFFILRELTMIKHNSNGIYFLCGMENMALVQ